MSLWGIPRILSYGIRNSRSEGEKARHTGSAKHGPFLLPARPSDFSSPILVGTCFVSRCYFLHFSDSSGVSWGSAGGGHHGRRPQRGRRGNFLLISRRGRSLTRGEESNPEHNRQEESTLVIQQDVITHFWFLTLGSPAPPTPWQQRTPPYTVPPTQGT